MASSPRRQLPGAGLLPAGFIDEAGHEDKEWPTTGAVLAREIPEFGEGELSERRSGLPIFLEDAEIDLLLSEIAEVVLQNQDYCFTSYECWQDTPAEKIDSPRIHDPVNCSGDECSTSSRPCSDFFKELDWSYPGKHNQIYTFSIGNESMNMGKFSDLSQENDWGDEVLHLDSSHEFGTKQLLDMHGTEKVGMFALNQKESVSKDEHAGLAKINTASEASDYKQIMSTLEDLKKANEEELTEFCRMYLELRCRCLMLQYENEALKGHFAREINLKEDVHSFCRPFTGLQDLPGIGKSLLDLSQVKQIM
ncbi:hypothetical protein HPP92_017390 [Vanilla planifolia]|uniref:Uncharacterized protein n=1 Tax=Vanilla planifolia TaxID=51239 RepID=A0A835QFB6_VANPL|nr:hypothetical protein HPP92_017390 [Vanilla planifolia]